MFDLELIRVTPVLGIEATGNCSPCSPDTTCGIVCNPTCQPTTGNCSPCPPDSTCSIVCNPTCAPSS